MPRRRFDPTGHLSTPSTTPVPQEEVTPPDAEDLTGNQFFLTQEENKHFMQPIIIIILYFEFNS